MTLQQWRKELVFTISAPTLKTSPPTPKTPIVDVISLAVFQKKIRAYFGHKHRVAGQTCIDTLAALINLAKERNGYITGLTQYEIGKYCDRYKSSSTVSKYTRELEYLGIISIRRSMGKTNTYLLHKLFE